MLRGTLLRIVALATLCAPRLIAQRSEPLGARVQHVMDRPEFKHAFFGVEMYDLDQGRAVFTLNPDKLFVAASTTKLLTMGTALQLLGSDYRFHTRVYRTGAIGADGALDGDLVLVASGDPNISGRIQPGDTLGFANEDHAYDADPNTRAVPGDPLLVIRQLASRVAARGVKRIGGKVLVDISLFPEGERELGTGVVISPIVVNDNLVDLMIGPGSGPGDATSVSISPATSYVRFVNTSTTGPADSRPRIRWSSDVKESDGSRTVTIAGTFPAGKPAILFSYAVPEPSRFAQVALVEALRERGITVDMPPAAAEHDFKPMLASYTPATEIAEHASLPYREEVKVTLKVSQNLHASSTPWILKAILAKGDTGKTGFDLERAFLQQAGLDLGGAQQSDGAGGDARFSPDFMVHYLAYMAKQSSFDAFLRALPILGKDGTLWNIQTASPAAGKVFAKTGTLGGDDALNRKMLLSAKGLAGYFTTPSGRRYAFAAYVNNVALSTEPNETTRVAGQALGEIAAAGYLSLP
jgi:PBP4 family serine-type D-alanyl-D-alanine carboxypeptidase